MCGNKGQFVMTMATGMSLSGDVDFEPKREVFNGIGLSVGNVCLVVLEVGLDGRVGTLWIAVVRSLVMQGGMTAQVKTVVW